MGTPDYTSETRKAMMACLKTDAPMLELVPAASQYGGIVPATRTLPFIRPGAMISAPFRASGMDSTSARMSWQAFTQGVKDSAGTVILPADEHIAQIASAMKQALDGAVLTIANVGKVRVSWIQTSPAQDPTESGAWMATVTFGTEVAG